jgi:hypothetical protein
MKKGQNMPVWLAAFLHSLLSLLTQLPAREECNKYDVTALLPVSD